MRASRYIGDVLRMQDDRWPKICLREEVRSILNHNPSKWGEALNVALGEMQAQTVVQDIWNRADVGMIDLALDSGLVHLKRKERAEDWERIEASSYNRGYQDWSQRDLEGAAKYWNLRGCEGWMKETWARLRCGNVGRAGKKGFKSWSCRLCHAELETLEHVWVCPTAHQKINTRWAQPVRDWVASLESVGLPLGITELLKGMPRREFCAYIAAFEKLIKEVET